MWVIVGNKFGDDGAKFISEGMKENTAITSLVLPCMFCIYFSLLSILSSCLTADLSYLIFVL